MMYCHAISHLRLGGKMIGVKDLDAENNEITKGILLLQPSILLSVCPGGVRPEVQPVNLF